MSIDYLLHESAVGYAIFKVVHQPDAVGNRLKEDQDSVQVITSGLKSLPEFQTDTDIGPCQIRQDGQGRQFCAFSVSS